MNALNLKRLVTKDFFLTTTLFYLFTIPCFAQSGMEKYFTESFLPTIDNTRYLDVKFEWTIPGKLQTSMNEGLTEMEVGNFKMAIVDFNTVLKTAPEFWPALYYRGFSRKALYKFDSAVLDFEATLKRNRNISEAHIAIGECYLQRFQFERAKKSFENAVDMKPDSEIALFSLGNAEFYSGNLYKALKYYERCNEAGGGYAPAYVMQALLKVKESGKKNAQSLSYLNKALAVDSTYREALFWRGFLHTNQDNQAKALLDWDRLVKYNPNVPYYLLLRGFLHIEMGDFDRAFNDLRKAVLSGSNNEDKFVGGQTVLDKQIDVHNATAYAMRFSYGLDPDALTFFKKGFCYFLSGDRNKADAFFRQAAAVQPSATVFYLQALNFEHLNAHDSAFLYYDKALALDNEIFDAHKKRGIYRFEVKDWRGAYQDFNAMIKLQPDTYVTYRLRGNVKSHQKDYYGAILDLTHFTKHDSTDHEVFEVRGFCRAQVGDKRGSLEDYRRALDLEWRYKLADEVVRGYAALGDTAETLRAIKQYKKINITSHFDRVKEIEIFIELKYWKHAAAKIEHAMSGTEDSFRRSELVFLKGLNHFYQSQYDRAVALFSDALNIRKENHEARYFRGKSLMILNRNEDALADFKILKKINYEDSNALFEKLKN